MKTLAISLALLTTSVMGGASAAHAQDNIVKTSDWAEFRIRLHDHCQPFWRER